MFDARDHAGIDLNAANVQVHCSVFEHNCGTLAICKEFCIRPCTKHINVKYWHFLLFAEQHKNILSLHWVGTQDQPADLVTKGLNSELHDKFTWLIAGWNPSSFFTRRK